MCIFERYISYLRREEKKEKKNNQKKPTQPKTNKQTTTKTTPPTNFDNVKSFLECFYSLLKSANSTGE